MALSDALRQHGTQVGGLPPTAVAYAAENDLRLRERKKETDSLQFRPYAFHRSHVKRASSPAELLSLALAEPVIGVESGKINTRMLYQSPDLLSAALHCASGAPV